MIPTLTFADGEHETTWDPASGIVSFTAHGREDGVRYCPGAMTVTRLAKIGGLHAWDCCDHWPN